MMYLTKPNKMPISPFFSFQTPMHVNNIPQKFTDPDKRIHKGGPRVILACAGYLTSRDRIGNPWKLQRLKLSDLKLQGPKWKVAESIRARK
jgi:hypothetical protein